MTLHYIHKNLEIMDNRLPAQKQIFHGFQTSYNIEHKSTVFPKYELQNHTEYHYLFYLDISLDFSMINYCDKN